MQLKRRSKLEAKDVFVRKSTEQRGGGESETATKQQQKWRFNSEKKK
jgi:hypothetical protein